MRLRDGLKRLWRWIRCGIRKVLDIVGNLACAFYRYTLKAYLIARFAIRIVSSTLKQYAQGQIDLPAQTKVQALIGGDGDICIVMQPGTGAEQNRKTVQVIRYFGEAFGLTCEILSAVMRILRHVTTATVSGLLGWARFLWMLVRSYREIPPWFRSVRQLDRELYTV